MESMNRCPPSRAGRGRRLIMLRLMLNNPLKYSRLINPAALPANEAIPKGPTNPSAVPLPEKRSKKNRAVPVNISHTARNKIGDTH